MKAPLPPPTKPTFRGLVDIIQWLCLVKLLFLAQNLEGLLHNIETKANRGCFKRFVGSTLLGASLILLRPALLLVIVMSR
jgi:hypothetical protein